MAGPSVSKTKIGEDIGWHTFRHSLASNMASAGVDQRIINETLGHHTKEMERRYRHLLPKKQADALHGLFQAAS